jgi:hypothetical protein
MLNRIIIIFASLFLIACKMEKRSQLSLIAKTELINFPSASSIEFYNDLLYVMGDDARNLAILDKNYKLVDSVELFLGEGLRIPKKIKTDLEASTVVRHKGKDTLMVAGSASTPEREYLLLFPLDSLKNYEKISTNAFTRKLLRLGLKLINFEGLALVNDMLVFGNRGNLDIPENHLVAVPAKELTALENATPVLAALNLNNEDGTFKGISGMAYIPSSDILFFTASTEHTGSAYEDGKIGHSYLGYIKKFSSKLQEAVIVPDELVNLSEMNPDFRDEKIESVAVESVGTNLILHLVADNDNGTSTLFKLSFPNPAK